MHNPPSEVEIRFINCLVTNSSFDVEWSFTTCLDVRVTVIQFNICIYLYIHLR